MAYLKSSFRFWANEDKDLRFPQKIRNQKCRGDKYEEPGIKMSDLNNSYTASIKHNLKTTDLDEDFDDTMSSKTHIYSSIVKLDHHEIIEQELNVEINEGLDADIRKFIHTQINFLNETQEIVVTKNDIITERIPYQDLINNNQQKSPKDTIFLENSPNNNSKEVKIIKVKIIVPKGALNNSLINKTNVLNIVNDLNTAEMVKNLGDNIFETAENTIKTQRKHSITSLCSSILRTSKSNNSNIYSSPSKPESTCSNAKIESSITDIYSSPKKIYKSPTKLYKSSKISKSGKAYRSPAKVNSSPFKSPRKSSPSKTYNYLEPYEIAELDNLVNRSHHYKPIMGKNALLAKAYASKNNSPIESNRDSEIVQELVTERFNDVLVTHYQKSFKRQTSRKDRTSDDENNVEDYKKEDSMFDMNLIKHSSTLNESTSNDPLYESITNYQLIKTTNEDANSCNSHEPNESFHLYESITNIHATNSCTSKIVTKEDFKNCASIEKQNLVLQSRPSSSSVDEHYSLHSFEVCSVSSFKDEINLNFILSTDDCNIETSFEVNNFSDKTEINEEGYETSSLHEPEEKVEYDAHKFLKAALGDEYISTDSQLEDSNEGTDLSSKNHSIGTSNISALISKASSLYSTISNKMHRMNISKSPTAPIYEEAPRIQNEYSECFPHNNKMSSLIQESVIQNQIMNQTSKALSLCKTIKEFVASVEQIEAERILLIATRKREAILEEIRKTEYEDIDDLLAMNLGTVKILNLKFPAKQMSPYLDNTPKRHKDFTQWFLCTVNSGPKLFATKSVVPDEYGMVSFDEEFIFEDLPADFEITISLYSMKVRNNMRNYSHESKYKLNKNVKHLCPTPPHKLFSLHKQSHKIKTPEDDFRPSSFISWGRLPLRINHLKNIDQFKLLNVPPCSTLDGSVIMDLRSELQLREKYSGFLNIGSESGEGVTWNRRWCCLDRVFINYYNYPREEDTIEPMGFIDLSCCVTSWVSIADREICSRPRTLLLETVNPPNMKRRGSAHSKASNNIIRHFLTADTADEVKMWETKLNSVVSALRNWKSMKVSLYFVK